MTPGWFVDNARYLLEPNVNPNTLSDYTNQMVNLLGLVAQGTAELQLQQARSAPAARPGD